MVEDLGEGRGGEGETILPAVWEIWPYSTELLL